VVPTFTNKKPSINHKKIMMHTAGKRGFRAVDAVKLAKQELETTGYGSWSVSAALGGNGMAVGAGNLATQLGKCW